MSTATYKVELDASEIVLLDGKCRPETQRHVNLAKAAATMAEADVPEKVAVMIAKAVEEATTNGRLIYRSVGIRYCSCCGKSAGYAKYKRSGRYHVKGDTDFNKPLVFDAWELADRFFRMGGYLSIGFCKECMPLALPTLQRQLAEVKAEIPEKLLGQKCRWKWNQNRVCKKCGWEGHEGEMGRLPVLMGGGTYAALCPKCNAGNRMFTSEVENRPGFTLTEVTTQ